MPGGAANRRPSGKGGFENPDAEAGWRHGELTQFPLTARLFEMAALSREDTSRDESVLFEGAVFSTSNASGYGRVVISMRR